ncbi:hypothetical protein CDD83_6058 [Cordyceps sp. RAO-2017]|nr:hypothetical protein CDD83_6058 [Cordyceps sp. RAO-2017]
MVPRCFVDGRANQRRLPSAATIRPPADAFIQAGPASVSDPVPRLGLQPTTASPPARADGRAAHGRKGAPTPAPTETQDPPALAVGRLRMT